MGRQDNLIKHAEAAVILGISRRQLWRLVNKGFIYPAEPAKHQQEALFHQEEVYALMEMRSQRLDIPSIATMAMQAQAAARTANGRLAQVCQLLGVYDNKLATDEDSIFDLYVRTRSALRENLSSWRTGAIMEWAATLNLIDEAYLGLVEMHTTGSSPWEFYLQLANEVMLTRVNATDRNLDFAFSCMDAARRNLRCVAYMYVGARHGYDTANRTFQQDEATDAVISQLYPKDLDAED